MRVRAMTATGDMKFGQGSADFLVNSPAAVAQLVTTRLNLWQSQWYLDLTDGTPWSTQVLGKGTAALYNAAVRNRIAATSGVTGLPSYSATSDLSQRSLTINATVATQYGSTPLPTATGPVPVPPVLVLNLPGSNALGSAILG